MRYSETGKTKRVAGGGTTALGIIGTTLGGLAVAGGMNGGGCCNGCNGGGILSNIFGGNNCDCHYESKESAALREQIAALTGMRYADQVGLEVYQEQAASDKEMLAYVNAGFTALRDNALENEKATLAALAKLDKDTALNKQAGEYQFVITNNKIDCVGNELNTKIDCEVAKTVAYVNATFVPGKIVMPLDSICPAAMPLCSTTTE